MDVGPLAVGGRWGGGREHRRIVVGTLGNTGLVAYRCSVPEDRPASLPGHLRLIDVVGTGGSATVWRARDRRRGRDVAVKVIELGSDGAGDPLEVAWLGDRFEREARALARLGDHPGVLSVHSVGVGDDGRAWLVTDLLPGGSLADRVLGPVPPVPLDPDRGVRLGLDLAEALAHAHAHGVVHGDVSPSNVLFDGEGAGGGRGVLADFGLARVQESGRDGSVVDGALTPAYAAPERHRGAPPTPASDVYGLGATLWAALAGTPPGAVGVARAAEVPRGVDEVLTACCRRSPADRPSAIEVHRSLSAEQRRRARVRRR